MPLYPLTIAPGIKRDGTRFDGTSCVDGQWVRWQGGRARKILGFRNMYSDFTGIVRGCNVFAKGGNLYVHAGNEASLERVEFDPTGAGAGVVDRTPSGFSVSDDNLWTFDVMFNSTSTSNTIIAHAAPNALSIDSSVARSVYFGDVTAAAALTAVSSLAAGCSGGIVVLHPYTFAYGSDGIISWTQAGQVNFSGGDSGTARITGSKVVKGLPYRGGASNAPAGLFWSLDSLIRVSYVGGSAVFRADTLSASTSILAQNSVIEYDGVYFWIENGRFVMFNGVIREIPNNYNLDWFFDNLNKLYVNKIWSIKNPRSGEIWWHFPYGDSTECNYAIILNVREQVFYDTRISRSAGFYRQVFNYPIMFDTEVNDSDKTVLWQHEFGYDEVNGDSVIAIPSYFETADISFCATGPAGQWVGEDRWVRLERIEPDFVQIGSMTATVKGNKYATSDVRTGGTYTYSASTTKIDMREQDRQLRIRFESNEAGGYYQQGQVILDLEVGDGRQ